MRKIAAVACLLILIATGMVSFGSFSAPTVTIVSAFNPVIGPGFPGNTCPAGGGQPFFCDSITFALPFARGIQMIGSWAQNTLIQGKQVGVETNTIPSSNPPNPATQYNTTNIDAIFSNFTGFSCGANLVGTGAASTCFVNVSTGPDTTATSVNQDVPQYVASQAWANLAAPAWVSGNTYSVAQTVCFPCDGSHYYQLTSTPTCKPTGSAGPSADGCSWLGPLAQAPPQDFAFSNTTGFSGSGAGTVANPNPPTSGIANVNTTNCTLANSNPTPCTELTLMTGYPVPWETPLTVAWQNFVSFYFPHLCSQLGSNIKYIRGLSKSSDGENNIFNIGQINTISGNGANSQSAYLADFTNFVNFAIGVMTKAGCRVPLMGGVNGGNATPFTFADNQAQVLSNAYQNTGYPIAIANQGWQTSDVTNYANGTNCSNDFCNIFNTYSGKIAFTELQPFGVPDPAATTQTGTLNAFQPFGAILRGWAPEFQEIPAAALLCATDASYSQATTCPGGTAPYLPWQTLEMTTAQGVPSSIVYGLTRTIR